MVRRGYGKIRGHAKFDQNHRVEIPMRKFMIERGLPGIGSAGREELKAAARKSNEALRQLGPDIQWIESFVTNDRTFCIYLAKDESLVQRHAEISGFPADRVTEIKTTIDPSTGGS